MTRWLWLIIPLVGVAELVAHTMLREAAPSPEEYQSLREPVQKLWKDGDLLVSAPYWAEPNLRTVFGDELMTLKDVARADDSGYARAVEVSILGEDSELFASAHGDAWRAWQEQDERRRPWSLKSESKHGKFTLRVWENPKHEPVSFDFVDALSERTAEVSLARKNQDKPCGWKSNARVSNGALHGHPTFPKQRFECTRSDWNFVGVTVIEDQNYRPRRCIWAHPKGGNTLKIKFPDVLLGEHIKGFGGLPWFLERESEGTDIKLTVLANGDELGDWNHKDGEGWKPFSVDTRELKGQRATVEFQVTSKRARQREFCFQADVR